MSIPKLSSNKHKNFKLMKKQIAIPLSCITNRITSAKFFSRMGSIRILILLMASLCIAGTASAQGPSSVPASEMHEMNLTAEDREARNEAAIATFISVYATLDYDMLDAILAPDFRHGSVDSPIAEGPAAFKAYMSGQIHAFQDVQMDVQHSVAEGGSGAVQWTLRVTEPVTGRRIKLPGMSLLRFQNGRIVEHIPYYNPAPLQED